MKIVENGILKARRVRHVLSIVRSIVFPSVLSPRNKRIVVRVALEFGYVLQSNSLSKRESLSNLQSELLFASEENNAKKSSTLSTLPAVVPAVDVVDSASIQKYPVSEQAR